MKPLYYGQHSIIGNSGTLRDFSLRENHLAGYPSLLSQEHNIRLAVRLLADAHPNPTSSDFAKLNIQGLTPKFPRSFVRDEQLNSGGLK